MKKGTGNTAHTERDNPYINLSPPTHDSHLVEYMSTTRHTRHGLKRAYLHLEEDDHNDQQ